MDATNRAAGVKDVASKLDISVESASAKANSLRKKGVELPIMRFRQDDQDIEALNAIIERKTLAQ